MDNLGIDQSDYLLATVHRASNTKYWILEKPNRVQALGYVFILVLLISSYLEYRIRKSLKENNEYVLLPGKKKTDRPTTKTIMEYFSFIIVVIINGQQHCFPSNCYE